MVLVNSYHRHSIASTLRKKLFWRRLIIKAPSGPTGFQPAEMKKGQFCRVKASKITWGTSSASCMVASTASKISVTEVSGPHTLERIGSKLLKKLIILPEQCHHGGRSDICRNSTLEWPQMLLQILVLVNVQQGSQKKVNFSSLRRTSHYDSLPTVSFSLSLTPQCHSSPSKSRQHHQYNSKNQMQQLSYDILVISDRSSLCYHVPICSNVANLNGVQLIGVQVLQRDLPSHK